MLSVALTRDEEERRIALKLRHTVFTKEMGRTALAKANGEYTDEFDIAGNAVFLARLSGEPIGTIRLCLRSTKAFWDEEQYLLNEVGDMLKVPSPRAEASDWLIEA